MFRCFVLVVLAYSSSANINSVLNTRTALSFSKGFGPAHMDSIASGAHTAMWHCQSAFKWDRWNCPASAFSRQKRQPITKEVAYVRAIISASIVHVITKNCSRGEIDGCGCDPKYGSRISSSVPGRELDPKEVEELNESDVSWQWGGCSDQVDYGEMVAKTFLNDGELAHDVQAHAYLHNNNVGSAVVRETLMKRCKCHGVSGSCSVQTCWMQLAPFADVAATLKTRYEHAEYVDYEGNIGNSIGDLGTLDVKNARALVYLEKSPDYCIANETSGWQGTKGRICSRSHTESTIISEKRSCKTLCRICGHRVKKLKKQVKRRCNCKFHWCCEVTCDTCSENVEEFFCD